MIYYFLSARISAPVLGVAVVSFNFFFFLLESCGVCFRSSSTDCSASDLDTVSKSDSTNGLDGVGAGDGVGDTVLLGSLILRLIFDNFRLLPLGFFWQKEQANLALGG